MCTVELGNWDEAKDALKRVLELEEKNVPAIRKLKDLAARKKAQISKDRKKLARMFGKGEYAEEKADRCLHCQNPVRAARGGVSGRFFAYDKGKVHEECQGDYLSSI